MRIEIEDILQAQQDRHSRERRLGLRDGWAMEFIPMVLPPAWIEVVRATDGAKFYRSDGLTVIVSASVEDDEKRWLHVSCSFPDRLPGWGDLKLVKRIFVGRDRVAYQMFPREAEYVNQNPNVLHLWAPLDGCPIPDFTGGTRSI